MRAGKDQRSRAQLPMPAIRTGGVGDLDSGTYEVRELPATREIVKHDTTVNRGEQQLKAERLTQ